MSYSVRLTNKVIRKVNGWGLSSHHIREILKGLDALATNPARQLIRVGPPYDALYYDLIVSEAGVTHPDILFSFTIRYGADEETLLVIGFTRIHGDGP